MYIIKYLIVKQLRSAIFVLWIKQLVCRVHRLFYPLWVAFWSLLSQVLKVEEKSGVRKLIASTEFLRQSESHIQLLCHSGLR